MAQSPTPKAPKPRRRFAIPLALLAGFVAGTPFGIYLDTKPSLSSLWKSTIDEAVDKRQWLHVGGCAGMNGKHKVENKVYEFAFGFSRWRKMMIDSYMDGGVTPTRTTYSPKSFESSEKFRERILGIAQSACGKPLQNKL